MFRRVSTRPPPLELHESSEALTNSGVRFRIRTGISFNDFRAALIGKHPTRGLRIDNIFARERPRMIERFQVTHDGLDSSVGGF